MCPAYASFNWRTPDKEGHYCLQARLVWSDDANPANNIGQENTNVGTMHSPAVFQFTVKNNASVRRKFIYEMDNYVLPTLEKCAEENRRQRHKTRLRESRARWQAALASQQYGMFSDLTTWDIKIDPEKEVLAAQEEIKVRVSIESTNPAFKGRKAFNIHVFALHNHKEYIGGVTLYVEK